MQVIYLDSLLLLNFILDYLLLLLAGRVAGAPLRRPFLALGAALGAAYAGAVVCLPGLSFLAHPLVRICAGVLMVLIAYGTCRRLFRLTALFFALSAALGGGLYALGLMGVAVTLEPQYILLFAAAAYCVLSLVGRGLARHGPRELRRVVVQVGPRTADLTALVDSGNTLRDPLTGAGVVVAQGERLAPLLPPEADFRHPCQALPALRDPRRFRLLPYRSVGVEQGLLLAVRADRVAVGGKELGPRLVALSPTPVSDGGGFDALVFEE